MKFYCNVTPYTKQLPYNISYLPDQFSVCYQYTMYHMDTVSATIYEMSHLVKSNSLVV